MSVPGLLRQFNFASRWLHTVPVDKWRLAAPTFDRWLYLQLHRWGAMGRKEAELLRRHVEPGMTVVDIGANIGLYTLLLAKLAGPKGLVHAFEPDPIMQAACAENLRLNEARTVTLYPLALGARSSRITLHRSVFNLGDNRLSRHEADSFSEPVEVCVARLDEVLSNVRIDFLKMDVQGWEVEVLRGMEGLLSLGSPSQMLVEYWPYGLLRAGTCAQDLLAILGRHGYRFQNPPALSGKRFCNVLASR